MRAVTSWGDSGHEVYGRKFLETWSQYVEIPLTVYTEGAMHEGFDCRNIWDIPGCMEFVRDAPQADNYRFDCKKFARKAYAQMDALQGDGVILWFDGDVEFSGRLTESYIRKIIGPYLSFMGRKDHYSCSSFVAWDTSHEDHPRFMAEYHRLYDERALYQEKEWHDAYILDVAIKKSKVQAKNLCQNEPRAQGSANVFDFVFEMAHHKKGPRKFGLKGG